MSAAEVVALNEELDRLLLVALARADLEERPESPDSWGGIEVAAHLAEFPRFFAEELKRLSADAAAIIGRTHEHEARLNAIAAARFLDRAQVKADVETAFAGLAAQLQRLTDTDISRVTNNVKNGEEPLSAFLDRYVIGHKAGHLRQLEELHGGGGDEKERT